MTDKPMNDKYDETLDGAIDAIKSEQPDSPAIQAAAERVKAALFNEERTTGIVPDEKLPTLSADRQLNSTDNYIAAIPDYLAGQLSAAQKLLFEEEARQSIPLRRALNAARQQQAAAVTRPRRRRHQAMRWFASAAAITVVAVGWLLIQPQLPAFNQSQLAQVEQVNGNLYQVAEGRLRELTPGAWLDGRQEYRTAKNTTAMVQLDDGSRVEIAPRSEFSLTRRGRGNRIDVNRGNIIVAASPQGSGTLDVATDEFVVSVTGTIFEVGHGTNGSRVSVIEGEVQVFQEGDSTSITPGEQFASRMGKTVLGIEDFSWSQNADEYIAMLREVQAFQEELQAVMETEPRYSTRLLNLVPESTVVYGAVPNAPEKISEIYAVIHDRVERSERLARAVARMEIDTQLETLDDVMTWLAEVGDTLGEETVAALVLQQAAQQNAVQPLILSEVDAEAFRETFESQLREFHNTLRAMEGSSDEDGEVPAQTEPLPVNIIDDPSEAQANQLSIWLHEDLLIASTNQQVLFDVQEAIITGGSNFMNTGLYAELLNFYQRGAEFLGAVDLEKIIALETSAQGMAMTGIDNAQYLVVHHQQHQGDQVNFTADLLFSGERHGVMSWLAAPSPMGSLEFFSGNTTFVNAGIVKDPSLIFDDIKRFTEISRGQGWDDIDSMDPQARQIRDNFIATLGGEVAFGLDGPMAPTPSWRIVIEVYDEILFQDTFEQAIELAKTNTDAPGDIIITPANVGIYTGYQLQVNVEIDNEEVEGTSWDTSFDLSINYAYVDGYLVIAPNLPFLERAINQYHSGSGLLAESDFQRLLPDNYLDVSALSYNRIHRLIEDLTGSLPTGVVLSEDQRAELRDIYFSNIGGSMLSVIGEPAGIRFVQSGNSLLPVNLTSIFSMESIAGIVLGREDLINITGDGNAQGDDDIDINIDL